MELLELKIRFEAGELKSAEVIPDAFSKGWHLLLLGTKKNARYFLSSQRSNKNEPRVFKTIDAASKVGRSIGFQSITVKFGN